ncbi:substrate-binding domain-containing protein [Boseongicola aestuarii]|uniref:Transcriptional repressor RbsR n=1 Tax=Boseongicola aestuarii TaxID=1470561 RepID=A0A238J3E7_9RHOB|nr:substrate-binding domain-containing protein [Boseongicola aestuarii]SMX25249.1 transcriptional repressor RbsR [Boseongicola aestuarii]
MADRPSGTNFVDTLRAEFAGLAAGTRVPTIRDVAARYSISQFSVQRAFESLKEEGLIQSFVGRGSFIAGGDQSHSTDIAGRGARVLIISHSTPSSRGTEITLLLQAALLEGGHKPICVSYADVSDLHDLLGKGGFDVCVLQPRRSILPVEALALLKSKARHMIVEGRQLEFLDVDVIVRNRAKSIALALRHLRELGHERIGLLTESLDAAAGYAEIENLYSQYFASSLDQPEPLILRVNSETVEVGGGEEIGAAMTKELAGRTSKPSAYIVSGRFKADDIRKGFSIAGLDVPGDVNIVHLRAHEALSGQGASLTTVGRRADHVASGIVDIVNWRLANPNEPAGLVLDDPSLVKGNSTCPFSGN